MPERLVPSRLSARNILHTAVVGVNTRRNRSVMSAIGIAIGIAAIVGVLGLSNSSRSNLINQIDALGTNLIQVQPQTGIGVGNAALPATAAGAIARIPNVQAVSQEIATGANVYRSRYVPSEYTAGLSVTAVDPNILTTLHGSVSQGHFLNAANIKYPVAVLGATAARALGIISLDGAPTVSIGGQNFTVVGILTPFPLSPALDSSAMVGIPAAVSILGVTNTPSTIDVRANPNDINSVLGALGATADPENPDQVAATSPTAQLQAKAAATSTLTELLLGLGAVALLVGGVGIANIMVITVLERRSEIGLRRALGATRRHIMVQFITESLMLAAIGGIAGVLLGVIATVVFAELQSWGIIIPAIAVWGGLLAALVIGGIAGLYPALRAARLSPTEALRST
jgi:putative ABC transport system permease protein